MPEATCWQEAYFVSFALKSNTHIANGKHAKWLMATSAITCNTRQVYMHMLHADEKDDACILINWRWIYYY